MAKILYVCYRDRLIVPERRAAIVAACRRLMADNLPTVPPHVSGSDGILIGVSNPNELIRLRGDSLAAGHLIESPEWNRPGTGRPDGAYAVFRADHARVELVTDALASRTIWYVLTDELFAASTSQRALVMLLGSFEFNPEVVPWMLATGTLGPGHSWDRRLRWAPGASRVVLDRQCWTLDVHTEPVAFAPQSLPVEEHEHRMLEAIRRSVQAIDTGNPHLAITLSGGYDCRTILCLLRHPEGMRAATWGLRASLEDPSNDAFIASQLAAHFGLSHQYFETDLLSSPIEQMLDRFVANGEGRIDHLSGYVDGFSLWSRLANAGVHGIIRGDHAFGRSPERTPAAIRDNGGIPLWSDFPGLPPLQSFGLATQIVPPELERRDAESLENWRDRLQQQYRVPFVLGALSDLKLPYVEILNPLAADSVVQRVRQLPEGLRTSKALLKQITRKLSPNIRFATEVAIQAGDDILTSSRIVPVLRAGLESGTTEPVVPSDLASYLMAGLASGQDRPRSRMSRRLRSTAKAWAPSWAKRLRSKPRAVATPSHNRLAFRALLAIRAYRLYRSDAEVDL